MSNSDQTTNRRVAADDPLDPMLGYRRLALLQQRLRRRSLLGGALGVAGLTTLGRLGAVAAPARQDEAALPEDAAPPEEQVYVLPNNPTLDKTPDFYESVYERLSGASSDVFSDPLVRLNRNFEIIPAAAVEWSGSDDGMVWTFQIDPNLMWNDGTPVTANDWVATFRHGADPAHAWDFTWFFQGILKNWNQAIAGEVPLEELGVRVGANDHELVVETEVPAPYLPAMLLYSCPLSAKALAEHGPLYNSDPETSVSAGPFMLSEWLIDQRVVYVKNPDYRGTLQVPINRVVIKLADETTWFTMYQNDEIDFMFAPAPAELQLAQAEFPDQIYSSFNDFRTFYLFFDVTKEPFDDLRVRQAFSHVVDRDAIAAQILGPSGVPAYSWLAPGFPAANGEALQEIQKHDPELAKQLLAEAGYPDGQGFPAQTLLLRDENPLNQNVANAIAAAIREQLGIDIEVSNQDSATFMASLTAKPTEILFGYVSYGMDFFDAYNMLSVWLSGGRHSWENADFDAKVREAAAFLGDPAERTAMFQEAERILVEEVPGVFVYHQTLIQLIKPWVKGPALEPDETGNTSIHWPGHSAMSTVWSELYIGQDAPSGREN